jgi:hypothetical protein
MIYLKSNKLIAPYNDIDTIKDYQTKLADDDEQIINLTEKNFDIQHDKKETRHSIFILDILFTFFFITPLVVFFWTSSWDIIYVYIFPNDFYYSILITFIVSNTGLFLCYVFQEKLTLIHNRLCDDDSLNYYNKAFYFRALFTYILTIFYVCSWKTYWDLYSNLAKDVEWFYFVGISLIAIISYRFILKKSVDNFTKTVPFYLVKDKHFDDYFQQPKVVNIDNVNYLNYLTKIKNNCINYFSKLRN